MKIRLLTLSVVLAGISLTGCAFVNDEDRDFYGKGWVHPTELDEVTPRHDPTAALAAANRPAQTSAAPAETSSPEWIVPDTSNNPPQPAAAQ